MPDNNAAERGMQAIALGRKNHLFVGSETDGKAAAISHVLIETAKLNAVDPLRWLADIIAHIPIFRPAGGRSAPRHATRNATQLRVNRYQVTILLKRNRK